MNSTDLGKTAQELVADGKGILAADETVATVTRRLAALTIESTPESRRAYREMFFKTPSASDFISGVIMQDETIHQEDDNGTPLADLLIRQGIIPGIKVDNGAKPLAGSPGEHITEGLDGLRERLREYGKLGARFAKWRAVIEVSDTLPSARCVQANAHALARYAAICQEQAVVPIVEPEVLMNGSHTIELCEAVTGKVLHAVFGALFDQNVSLEGMLLKPNMVISGGACTRQAPVKEVAVATLRCLQRHVPAAVPGIVFLSGGQGHLVATIHLHEINQLDGPKPWKLSFSYGRALQDEALKAWRGNTENCGIGQRAFYNRARCNSAAARGRYSPSMESEVIVA
ncbi:MAG TPA: class I fructose-bisphosphate aldolase [Xanthobacteraceae bacterium]|jgi:fructose-bisphosphate aldolase class I